MKPVYGILPLLIGALSLWSEEVSLRVQKSENLQDWESLDLIRNNISGTSQRVFFRVEPEITDEMPLLAQLKPGTRIRESYTLFGTVYTGDTIVTNNKTYLYLDADGDYKIGKAAFEMNAEGNAEITIQQVTEFEKPGTTKEEETVPRNIKFVYEGENNGNSFELLNGVWTNEFDSTFEVIAPSGLAPDNLLGLQQKAFFYYEHLAYVSPCTVYFDATDPYRLQFDYGTRLANYTYHYEKLTDSVGRLKTAGQLASGESYFGEYTLYFHSATAAYISGYEVNATDGLIQAWGFLGNEGSLPIDYGRLSYVDPNDDIEIVSLSGEFTATSSLAEVRLEAPVEVLDPVTVEADAKHTEVITDAFDTSIEESVIVIEGATTGVQDPIEEEDAELTDESMERVMTQAHPVVEFE
jgi:hypothetical protein